MSVFKSTHRPAITPLHAESRRVSRSTWVGWLLALSLALPSGAEDVRQDSVAQRGATVEIIFENLRNEHGNLTVLLFAQADGFPTKFPSAEKSIELSINTPGRVRAVFDGLKPGRYAIAAIHDENENDRLDENFLCIPTEGYGFSNNAVGLFGLPASFDSASFIVEGEGVVLPTIQIRY